MTASGGHKLKVVHETFNLLGLLHICSDDVYISAHITLLIDKHICKGFT